MPSRWGLRKHRGTGGSMYEKKELCAACGGKCCKGMPGSAFPSDFGELLLDALVEKFQSGLWVIDWWEGDPRGKGYRMAQSYFVRPAIKGANALFHPSWGGECIFLSEDGCTLPSDERPLGCKRLEPGGHSPCMYHGDGTGKNAKHEGALAWLKHQLVILQAAKLSGRR